MPRPGKQILVFSADEMNLSVISFVLRIHGYRVCRAQTKKDATDILQRNSQLALLLIDEGFSPEIGHQIEQQKRETRPELATYRIYPATTWTIALKDIRVVAQRKRGPAPKKPVLREKISGNLRKNA